MSLRLRVLACVLLATHAACAQDVRIGVLGLFHPGQITLQAGPAQAVIVHAGAKIFVLERSSGQDAAKITISGGDLIIRIGSQSIRTSSLRASSRSDGGADFVLSVPGKISRRYRGVLEVKAVAGALVPVVQMDLETAVASVVQAESAPGTPLEALKAQAVASRSYFTAARGRHHEFDFCDTTHCQFLRQPPPSDSDASHAAKATEGLVLAYRDQAVAAMFTRSCGGRTRTPQEVGLSSHAYPYFPVACDHCQRHPSRWVRRVSPAEAGELQERGEASRLALDRRLGWDAVPSNNFTAHSDAQGVILEGRGEGHGIGLCQAGARAMAQAGAAFRKILEHYYPNTVLMNRSAQSGSSASHELSTSAEPNRAVVR
jgi:stage II sporulation protein D (peptidoglycan lytic transglycosylase)